MCASIILFAALYATQAEASVTIFLDEFNAISGWGTEGEVFTNNNESSPAPSGDPAATLKANPKIVASIWRSISTVGYNNIGFSVYRRPESFGDSSGDIFTMAWRKTGDPAWNILETLDYGSSWEFKNWVLPSSANNSSVDVKFSLYNNSCGTSKDYVHLDDFKLTGDHTNGGDVIPEPVTTLLFGSGLAFGAFLRRKKRLV